MGVHMGPIWVPYRLPAGSLINDVESIQKSIVTSYLLVRRVNQLGKLINSRPLISNIPGSALRTHVESLGKPRDVNKRSRSLTW